MSVTVSRRKRYARIVIYVVLSIALAATVILGCFLEILPISRLQSFAAAVVLGLFLLEAIIEEAEHRLARAVACGILCGGATAVVIAGYFFELFPVNGREAGAYAILAGYFFLMTLGEVSERWIVPKWLGLIFVILLLFFYFAAAFIIAAARSGGL